MHEDYDVVDRFIQTSVVSGGRRYATLFHNQVMVIRVAEPWRQEEILL
jgi:hypothetical protein